MMKEVLTQVPANVPVLLAVLLLERLFPLRDNINPLSFFRALALSISRKVHSRKKQHPVAQQRLAGMLAIPTLLLPFLFLGYMMSLLVEYPQVFDALLLWICLAWSPLRKDALTIAKALDKQQKNLARAKLSPWVLRTTTTLSPMGVCKATVETVAVRSARHYFAVIFYFLTLGSFAMLCYRLIMMLGKLWNCKIPHYRHFGKPIAALCYIVDWLPGRLVAFTIMLLNNFKLSFRLLGLTQHRWHNLNSLYVLAATAAALRISLGGPAMYGKEKVRRAVIGNDQTGDPNTDSIRYGVKLVEKVLLIWLLLTVLLSTAVVAVRVL